MSRMTLACLGFGVASFTLGCNDSRRDDDNVVATLPTSGASGMDTDDDGDDEDSTGGVRLDAGNDTDDTSGLGCLGDASCDEIDILFVIDNSGTMAEEQLNLAANFPLLVQRLQNLTDAEGNPVNPSVNIMVTTTDVGHPLCTPFEKPGYRPARGAPIYEGCNARIDRFTGLDPNNPVVVEEACTTHCPVDIVPGDPFIHFGISGSNVPNDDIAGALSCIGPQGIDGCGMEAQLEAMLQAINPTSCWNNPSQEQCQNDPKWSNVKRGFLRDNATLAIVIVTDEVDCSNAAPEGFSYFTNENGFWETNPVIGIAQATSAVCWNAGVTCSGPNAQGVFTDCTSADNGVLQPVDRYISYLQWLVQEQHKEVVMLGILGVPPVTERNPEPPFQPIAGGALDIVYRDWIDGVVPDGDILPDQAANGIDADWMRFDLGIGPGCIGHDEATDTFTGQAVPPVRIKEVCESLNRERADGTVDIRCCIESICDQDFSPAIDCLTGILSQSIPPAG
jgi:hypothetical protein